MKFGVISDTHGFFDPQIPALFAGVRHIFHAGDIGQTSVVQELEKIAPVTAVTGNTDSGLPYPETVCIELYGWKILVHHIVEGLKAGSPICRRIEQEQPDAVVFGHTHCGLNEQRGKTLFFNPGYAGRPGPGRTRSAGLLQVLTDGIHGEWLPLSSSRGV